MFKNRLALILLFLPSAASADSRLLYLEAQAVSGYSTRAKDSIFRSGGRDDVMQKTSEGLDYIHKFSGPGGDRATLAIESRVAWDPDSRAQLQPQLYNAYLRMRTPYGYAWAGHNRISMGLESYFDTHAALVQTLQMYGAGFDRDWGAGVSREFDWADASLSLTTGSGMPLVMRGNHLVTARISEGVLNRDNYNNSVYAAAGRIPDITGYRVDDPNPRKYSVVGTDFAYLWDRFELRGDLRAGEKLGRGTYAALGRLGINLMEENRLKLEFQTVLTKANNVRNYFLTSGAVYALTADLSLRALFEYEDLEADKRLVTQVYYYFKLL